MTCGRLGWCWVSSDSGAWRSGFDQGETHVLARLKSRSRYSVRPGETRSPAGAEGETRVSLRVQLSAKDSLGVRFAICRRSTVSDVFHSRGSLMTTTVRTVNEPLCMVDPAILPAGVTYPDAMVKHDIPRYHDQA